MKKEKFVVVKKNVNEVESVVYLDKSGEGFGDFTQVSFNTIDEAEEHLTLTKCNDKKIVKLTYLVEDV